MEVGEEGDYCTVSFSQPFKSVGTQAHGSLCSS